MVNSLRHYHLGCGERLQAISPLTLTAKKNMIKQDERSKDKVTNTKGKGQH